MTDIDAALEQCKRKIVDQIIAEAARRGEDPLMTAAECILGYSSLVSSGLVRAAMKIAV